MDSIMLLDKSIPQIGLKARKSTNGPKYRLVERFIDYKVNRFQSRKNRKTALAVFVEPFLETGFPDVVFSEYDPSRFDQWSDDRRQRGWRKRRSRTLPFFSFVKRRIKI